MARPDPQIVAVEVSDSLIAGSPLRIKLQHASALGTSPQLELRHSAGMSVVHEFEMDGDEFVFAFPPDFVGTLGAGAHDIELQIIGRKQTNVYPLSVDVIVTLEVELHEGMNRKVFHNENVELAAENFLLAGEGDNIAHIRGHFLSSTSNSKTEVALELPITTTDRRQASLLLSTELGSIDVGQFEGTLQLELRPKLLPKSISESHSLNLQFLPPKLDSITPKDLALGAIVNATGKGFVGSDDEVTLIRAVSGTITPQDGPAFGIVPQELYMRFLSGEKISGEIEFSVHEGQHYSTLFAVREGEFDGIVRPVTIKSGIEVEGDDFPIKLNITGPRQVVWLHFLPAFYESLTLFGLNASEGIIEEKIRQRVVDIFSRWNLDVRLQRPEDFARFAYSVVEIGGPDPNGLGVFGYDNTPNKDIGNLRLNDYVGGENAATREDGNALPYGGIFIESLFQYSAHPPSGEASQGAPIDEYFDLIFDSIRAFPASVGDFEAGSLRFDEVHAATNALANIVGETTAHELGHSFGLAKPFGDLEDFHNSGDRPGCLMDRGTFRPLAERAGAKGEAATTICGTAAQNYLDDVL